ncbi:MAG: DUF6194 family protein [Planctomycetota bacterium]|nr:DUF6194 family protein [Planctomycetota bacterium]
MDEATVTQFIIQSFHDVQTQEKDGVTFFFFGPDRMFPFATLVTCDNAYDSTSNLDRPGIFRLNLGIGKATFHSLFGDSPEGTSHDFTALDLLLPHPFYGKAQWVCVLNPGEATFQARVAPLIAEAYENDVRKKARKGSGVEGDPGQ